MDEATRLPVKTEKRAPVAAPAQWMPFESLRREIDRIFNSFRLGIPFRRALEVELPWRREMNWGIAPAFDVAEKDKEYEITAVLPGMDEKNIEIKLSNGALTIRARRRRRKRSSRRTIVSRSAVISRSRALSRYLWASTPGKSKRLSQRAS